MKKIAIFSCSLYLLFVFATADKCDKNSCKGPIRFYEDLKCKPIFKNRGDCCAYKYDCSNLDNRPADKCYANGHQYAVEERLRPEDQSNPCNSFGCFCYVNEDGVGTFACPIVDCFPKEAKPGCYLRPQLDSCCAREEICPDNPQRIPKCLVDGVRYSDGDRFVPKDQPNLLCQCGEGYKGKNVPPFCRNASCGTEQLHHPELRKKCAPVYDQNVSLITKCAWAYRCQNVNDTVIRRSKDKSKDVCQFGNLTLNIGDELSQSTEDVSACVKCTCEVPPALTCIRLTNKECDAVYPKA